MVTGVHAAGFNGEGDGAARVSNGRSGFDLGTKGWGVGIGGVGVREGLYMVYGIGSDPLGQMISTAWI